MLQRAEDVVKPTKLKAKSYLKGVLLSILFVVALHDLAVDAEAQDVAADLIILDDRRDLRQASLNTLVGQRILHRLPLGFLLGDSVALNDELRHHHRLRALALAVLLLVLLENGPLRLPGMLPGHLTFSIQGV